jgi:hypothetical protein
MDADQFAVPLAVPDEPVLVNHVTEVTPTLSLAVPLNTIVADDVETVAAPGDAIVNAGGVVSVPDPAPDPPPDPPPDAPPDVGGAAGAVCLVTVTTCDT